MNRFTGPLLLILIAAGGLALRLPNLAERPFHADESVHALKFRDLWERGTYRYDPNEFHGPTLYDATLPVIALSRTPDFAHTNVKQYRAVPIVFGVLLILAVFLLRDGLGWPATIFAALFCAVSPACVFYSRYYIQEMLLVCFTAWTIGCGWQWRRTGRFGWAVATGIGAGLMWSTKETAVFCFLAAGIAWAVARRGREAKVDGQQAKWLVLALLATVVAVMSGLFRDAMGPIHLLQSYLPWLNRVGGAHHDPLPWYHYLAFLLHHHERGGPHFSEALILTFGLVGMGGVPGSSRRLARFLTVYTLVLTAIYSITPYKMPWLALGFLHGWILLAGLGAARLLSLSKHWAAKSVIGLLLVAGAAQLGGQSYQLLFNYNAIDRNPYVYSETAYDMIDLEETMQRLVAASGDPDRLVVQVFATDPYYWPLPWYLRAAPHVGYWMDLGAPLQGQIILASSELHKELEPQLEAKYESAGNYGLRLPVVYELWVEKGLWERFLETP